MNANHRLGLGVLLLVIIGTTIVGLDISLPLGLIFLAIASVGYALLVGERKSDG